MICFILKTCQRVNKENGLLQANINLNIVKMN